MHDLCDLGYCIFAQKDQDNAVSQNGWMMQRIQRCFGVISLVNDDNVVIDYDVIVVVVDCFATIMIVFC